MTAIVRVLALAVLIGGVARAHAAESEIARYQHHILAVDEHGSAVVPIVTRKGTGEKAKYRTSHRPMEGEDTRKLSQALAGRQVLNDYLTAMFNEAAAAKPREVVVYVHGGLNNIDGAISKAAFMTDYFADSSTDRGIYYIGICWNSDLSPTYGEHLWSVREGLRQPGRAILSAPAAIIADVGSAIARTPLRVIDLLFNDVQTVNPNGFTRHRVAEARYRQLKKDGDGLQVSRGDDERNTAGKAWDAASWVVTSPVKLGVTPLIDTLGVQPWKNMLRRTRTMFERETNFIPELEDEKLQALATSKAVTARKLREQLTYTARAGATRLFCNYASDYFTAFAQQPNYRRPTITLIGHSMGAIVSAEMLHRAHFDKPVPCDNVVLMAAACSINEFKNKIVPYLSSTNAAKGRRAAEKPTQFYNLCLNDNAERGEKNPGKLDLSPRGSLLVWIDTLYQEPESENDRTFGRWENAILASDDIPSNVARNMTIKTFGRDRSPDGRPIYTIAESRGRYLTEPTKHGEFTRFQPGRRDTNFAFWRPIYWEIEEGR
jgi:hypothetical protein